MRFKKVLNLIGDNDSFFFSAFKSGCIDKTSTVDPNRINMADINFGNMSLTKLSVSGTLKISVSADVI